MLAPSFCGINCFLGLPLFIVHWLPFTALPGPSIPWLTSVKVISSFHSEVEDVHVTWLQGLKTWGLAWASMTVIGELLC